MGWVDGGVGGCGYMECPIQAHMCICVCMHACTHICTCVLDMIGMDASMGAAISNY